MEARPAKPGAKFKRILMATDFSSHSDIALTYALSIAKKYASKVIAAHVMPLPAPIPHAPGMAATDQQLQDARKGMGEIAPRLAVIPHEQLLTRGAVWPALSEIVRNEMIDLIVIGTHGRAGVTKLLMGSVAEKIFRQAPCPVLTVGPGVSGEPESIVDLHEILFATDFSAESLAALPYAISLAQEDRARLYLLHIAGNSLEPAAEAVLKSQLRHLVPPDADLSCEPKAFVEFGSPAQKILELAEELSTDLIVLGVKRTPVHFEASTHLPLATAYKVVSQAICPVLTVRG